MTDDYIKSLEREAERNNKIISSVGELVDEGMYTTSVRAAHEIFREIGELIGLDMTDAGVEAEMELWDVPEEDDDFYEWRGDDN